MCENVNSDTRDIWKLLMILECVFVESYNIFHGISVEFCTARMSLYHDDVES